VLDTLSDRFTTVERTIGSDWAGGWVAKVGLEQNKWDVEHQHSSRKLSPKSVFHSLA